jgi:hypothetical protein
LSLASAGSFDHSVERVLVSNRFLSNFRVLLRTVPPSFFIVAVFHLFTLDLKDDRALAGSGSLALLGHLLLENLGRRKFLTSFHVMCQEVHSPFSPIVYILVRQNLACLDHSINLHILQFDQLSAGNYLVLSLREPKHTALTGQGGISVL